ncbi:aldo/keto reductase [Clostridium botulinum]|uniref:aldo/keto reductase n=1 Tax=Clostridium botulinum TaxID=1491 RepID=UPI0005F8D0D4|nr:aldo/keto reductase [Clostridium botulinum]KOM98645.1 aldo/keto reductase [Clostridium botulinum]KON00107.1 aldo/keto reductase [Clostridium botulinum]MBY7002875.1 aldo/keto reductase [Clostridium botulinum]MCR1146670.1 aldo/keto reductase [Clostridium botulinum]NFH92459.1 aldo/keto reductase [Clostridium botulinum]
MIFKQYGNTGINVSAVGMGCMRFNEEDIIEDNLSKCAEIILYAHENGINYFDTAPFYCHDKSEIIAGMALSQLPRSSYYVTSKTNVGTLRNNCTIDGFFRRLETSLKRLKVDYIDFYHMWCMIDSEMLKLNCDKLYKFFEQAKSQGLIRHIVMSSHMQGESIEEAVKTGLFEGITVGYNVLNYKYRQSGIEAAYNKGIGVSVMNPLGGGVIVQNPNYFKYLTEDTNLNVAQAALRFVVSHEEISVVLTGFSEKAHVDDAVKSVESLVTKPIKDISTEYESKGSTLNNLCTGCGYCNYCPVGIEIPKFMDSYNEKFFGNSIKKRLRTHWYIDPKVSASCMKCGKCEKLCTQHLPIRERLREISLL